MELTTEEGTDLLREYVGAGVSHNDLLTRCWETATGLVGVYVGTSVVPAPLLELATLQVAAELFQRQSAPNGIAQFQTPDGTTGIRVARDPMLSAYPILKPFLKLGFA
ncbi:hypothetical protein LQ938_09555 [Microbacterium sp. cx-55]|uniref:hypothetical protein n=1 Tax=Microbacterium sp. cx-55 TaxID=2875948 RepID=UPI001CBBB712|nr:hypothetical protein [Microbacterium sp. cx-55]MBZ4485992.1 hypothetical protein [Microbacterium sp. cx-55]UGB34134.1 hypothetical protein LQ938_09555 [Microbacterium sp. cx-55]